MLPSTVSYAAVLPSTYDDRGTIYAAVDDLTTAASAFSAAAASVRLGVYIAGCSGIPNFTSNGTSKI